jgi:hypothetical protein
MINKTAQLLVVAISVLAFALTCGAICSQLLLFEASNGNRDFIAYWTAGQLAVHHQNPYDAEATFKIETAHGRSISGGALVMRNPPTGLLLALPLGFMSVGLSAFLWTAAQVLCIVVSVRMIWSLHGRPPGHRNLLGYSFGPAVICLMPGQTSLFVLLGLVLFLRSHQSRPFWAGASLWLCALKPHLLLPFAVALLVWIIAKKKYPILIGLVSSLAVSAIVASAVSKNVWTNYRHMMTTSGIDQEFLPCLSSILRVLTNHYWAQYLPAAAGCIWALYYLRKHIGGWDWLHHGSLLILVSLFVAPYEWFTDTAIALPALLAAVYVCRSRALLATLALASAAVEIQLLYGFSFHSRTYLWLAPAWLAWYLLAIKGAPLLLNQQVQNETAALAPAP